MRQRRCTVVGWQDDRTTRFHRITARHPHSPTGLGRSCLIDCLLRNDKVDTPIEQSLGAFARGIYDRLLVDIKAGVDQHRDACGLLEGHENIEIEWIGFANDGRRPRRPVDMHYGWDAITPV